MLLGFIYLPCVQGFQSVLHRSAHPLLPFPLFPFPLFPGTGVRVMLAPDAHEVDLASVKLTDRDGADLNRVGMPTCKLFIREDGFLLPELCPLSQGPRSMFTLNGDTQHCSSWTGQVHGAWSHQRGSCHVGHHLSTCFPPPPSIAPASQGLCLSCSNTFSALFRV